MGSDFQELWMYSANPTPGSLFPKPYELSYVASALPPIVKMTGGRLLEAWVLETQGAALQRHGLRWGCRAQIEQE